MINNFIYDAFLYHSTKDTAVVGSLAERLRGDSLRIDLGSWETQDGDGLRRIDEAMEDSRVLVLCVSVHALPFWPQIKAISLRFRNPQYKERNFIPLQLDNAHAKYSMEQFLWIQWFPENLDREYKTLLRACQLPCRPISGAQESHGQLAEHSIRLPHPMRVYSFAFSSDGKRVLTSSKDRLIRLWDVEAGLCLRILEGHTSDVNSLAWSIDQRHALSSADDNTLRLWDVETAVCVRVLKGHTNQVWSVAWETDRQRALSSGGDQTIRLWDIETGQCLRVFEGHTRGVWSVKWSPDHQFALSGSIDTTVRLWDLETGRCLRLLEGHMGSVRTVAWSSDQRQALSGSEDNSVRLWDLESGRCLRVFEGHLGRIEGLVWSSNQRHALSCSSDRTVRLWDVKTGRCLSILEGHATSVESVAWGSDQRYAFSGDKGGGIRRWNLSNFVTEGSEPILSFAPEQVQYANAKVLLVGDTGVGKSGLAERLVHKKFIPTKSSHARRTYVLGSNVVHEDGGVSLRQEIALWDLAGQPAYRLVHQLSMENSVLACVLFDSRNETNPFESAAYWSQALDQTRANKKVKKLLVASRIDVGGLPAGRERIENFARENDFVAFLSTSAYSGHGCDQLLAAITEEVPWGDIPRLTTTKTLVALREFVTRLKIENSPINALTAEALYEGFASYFCEKVPLDEFMAYLSRLRATDEIAFLTLPSADLELQSDDIVLLDSTRVDAYASALLVEAKDEPDGPGHLLESHVLEGAFKLDKEERIADRNSERQVLSYVVERLLVRDLALREKINEKTYLVFPSQCTTEFRFPGTAAFGIALGFSGAIRNIYATLIAQLAHYEGFKKREFFQDAAVYHAEAGGCCIVHFYDLGHGRGELEVLFDKEAPEAVRQGFLEFVSKHVEARSGLNSLTRRHSFNCRNERCSYRFEDQVVKARLGAGKNYLLCPICELRTTLVDLLSSPTATAASVAVMMGTNARAGRQRMTAAFVIGTKEAEGKFDVFLSHNSKDKEAVEKIAKQLKAVGLRPWLDKWNLAAGDTVDEALEQAIKLIPCAALFFGPADVGAWHILEIRAYVAAWAKRKARIIPVILPGVQDVPELPLFVQQTLWVDMRDWEKDQSDGFYYLVCGILARAPGYEPKKRFGVRDVAEWQGRIL